VALAVDGDYGPVTAVAVAAAQVFFGEHGVLGGVCDQAMFSKLAGAVPVALAPPPVALPAPSMLKVTTTSTGAHATLSWSSVPNVELYKYQLEYYKPKFGWVLVFTKTVSTSSDTQLVAPATKFRFRAGASSPVSASTWSAWAEFTTS
jgi:peptidoglycan hydrolase-like protein with peptidoglycan-binding domain